MGGFGNFAADIGNGLTWVIPTLCYVSGGALLIASIYGFWQLSKGEGSVAAKPWMPFVSLLVAATLLSFETLLTAANASFGFTSTVGLGGSSTAAGTSTSLDADTLVGSSPTEMLTNILNVFSLYFETFGALIVFMAVLRLRAHLNGTARSSISYCMIKAGAGVLVMNAESVVPLLAQPFQS